MTLTIRPLTPADKADWSVLWNEYLAYYETSLPADMYDLAFERMLSGDDHEFHGMMALLDGKPVGLVHYLYHRHGWKPEPVCYLQDLYVSPETRGTGAGRALIEAVYKAADKDGAPSVYWLTQDFNISARKLYDRIATQTPFIKYAR